MKTEFWIGLTGLVLSVVAEFVLPHLLGVVGVAVTALAVGMRLARDTDRVASAATPSRPAKNDGGVN